jgi:ABC-type uncharacterized transport system substrate-binding protein
MTAGYGLAGKRVELLKNMVRGLSRVAVLNNPGNPTHVSYLAETQRVATALGLDLGRSTCEALMICLASSQR